MGETDGEAGIEAEIQVVEEQVDEKENRVNFPERGPLQAPVAEKA